jgi:hypothetical protein
MAPTGNDAAPVCTRRGFLLTALVGVLGAGVFSAGCQSPADTDAALTDWLLSGYSADRDAAARLGRAYLRDYPAESDRDALSAAIDRAVLAHLDGGEAASADRARLGAALQRTVRAEYAADSVVVVGGWVLSVTEARLYAAIALA